MSTRLLVTVYAIMLSGCVTYALRPNVPAFQRTFKRTVSEPQTYKLRVLGQKAIEYTVDAGGDVTISVPESPRACDKSVFGINRGGSGWPKLFVLKSGRKVRELSPLDLYEMAPNEQGVYELTLK